jgi:hypothetical protein
MLLDLAKFLQTTPVEVAKLLVSIITLVGTAVAVVVTIKSFRRTEQWKRAEFLATEMKEFFADPRVCNALSLIDWGARRIPLLEPTEPDQGKVRVTRQFQVRALLPHTLLDFSTASDADQPSEITESKMRRYSTEEAAIRDCFDAFLDGLERFSSYVQTGLVSGPSLRPYIGYWIDDIHAATRDPEDTAWAATLLTYIAFYRFKGVLWLFSHLDRNISPDGATYLGFLRQMQDQRLAVSLARAVDAPYNTPIRSAA